MTNNTNTLIKEIIYKVALTKIDFNKLDEVTDQILALIESEKKKARQELYEAFDKKYKDFELTKALGEVLRELEKEE